MQDSLVTSDPNERNALVKQGWTEICTPFGDSAVFCNSKYADHETHAQTANNETIEASVWSAPGGYTQGPFLMYTNSVRTPNLSTKPVYRCLSGANKHLISIDANCGGLAKPEHIIGYVSQNRSSNTPR